jgi:hypothetical protein
LPIARLLRVGKASPRLFATSVDFRGLPADGSSNPAGEVAEVAKVRKWQAAIVQAERNGPKLRIVSGD